MAINERSFLEEEALKYFTGTQSAVAEEAAKQKIELAPLSTPEGRYQRGLVDENEEATAEGELFIDLLDAGLFDPSGALTPKGQAFALDNDEALKPENLSSYIIRDKAGLNDTPDIDFGDAVSGVLGFAGDAVMSLGRLARQVPGLNPIGDLMAGDSAEREAEDLLTRQAFAEGALEGSAQLGAGLNRMNDKLWFNPQEDEQAFYLSKQNYERFKRDLDDANAAELYGGLVNSAEVMESLNAGRDQARQRLGNERADVIERQGEAGGQLFGDPSNVASAGVGAAVGGAGKLPLLSKLGAKAEAASQAALRASQKTMQLERAKLALSRMERGAQVASTQSERALQLGRGQQARRFYQTGERLQKGVAETQASIATLEREAADAAAQAAKLADEAGGAPQIMAAIDQAKQIGRQVRSAPARVLGPVMESIGENAMKADAWLTANLKGFESMRNTAAALGVLSGSPALALPAAIRAAGPVVKGIGGFTKIIGKELMEARGTVPFWRRVAENSATTPLQRATAHAFDFATLGGKLPNAVKRGAMGAAAAAPVDMAFEVIGSGGDLSPNTLKQGLAESLVFGGGGAFGGAMTKGRLNDLRARSAGDEINFRRNLSPEDTTRFALLGAGPRKALATYAASFPGLKFKLTDEGPSSYDRGSNTATINTKTRDFLRPVIAHEVNHHLEVVGQAAEGIRALLVGEGQGGLLRSKDGKLDKNFRDFMEAYNRRANAAGLKPLSVEDAAIEYFNEATVDYLMGDQASTKLQRRAARSAGERMLRDLVANTVAEIPLVKNLFFRTGGALDGKGRMVQGNGILATGVREMPEAKKLFDKLVRANAGRPVRGGGPLPSPVPETITIKPGDPAIDTMFSAFETDAEGNVMKGPRGEPVPLKPETEKARRTVGKAAIDAIEQQNDAEARVLEGQPVQDPDPLDLSDPIVREEVESETPEQKSRRVKRNAKGDYEGTHLSPKAVQAIRKRGALNPHQVAVLRTLNRSARDLDGSVFGAIVHTATKRKEGSNTPSYGSVSASMREFVPLGMKITKGGNVTVSLLEGNQLAKNIDKRAASETGKRLYGGNEVAILADVQAVLDLWRSDQKTDGYFQAKYGDSWKAHKNFINTVLNTNMNEQKEANPLFAEDEVRSGSVIKTYRIDRISKLVKNREGKTMPVGPNTYEHAKINYLPEPME